MLLNADGPHAVTGPRAVRHPWTAVRTLRTDLTAYACAVADGMRHAGLSPVGAEQVRVVIEPDGEHRIHLGAVDEQASAMFAECLHDVLAPIGASRYVVARYLLGCCAVSSF